MDSLEETGLTPADPGFYAAARQCVIDLGIVRRRKVDVAADIPARRIADLPVELDEKVGRSIRAAERDLARRMVSRYETALASRRSGAVVEGIDHDLVRKVARWEQKDASTSTTGENVFSMMRRIGQAKAGLAADYAAQLARSAGKVVFFAKHVDVMDVAEEAFAKQGIRFSSIRGDQTPTSRQKNIDAFVNDPDVAVAVCSLTAAGVGINLQVASNIVLAELSWTDAEQTQAIDRSHRIGQTRARHRVAHHRRADDRQQDRRADRQQGRPRRQSAGRLGRGGLVVGRRAARGAGRVADRRAVDGLADDVRADLAKHPVTAPDPPDDRHRPHPLARVSGRAGAGAAADGRPRARRSGRGRARRRPRRRRGRGGGRCGAGRTAPARPTVAVHRRADRAARRS